MSMLAPILAARWIGVSPLESLQFAGAPWFNKILENEILILEDINLIGNLFLSARRALLWFLCCHDLSLLFVGFFFVICGILLGYL